MPNYVVERRIEPTSHDLAYAAGIIDGEGSIYIGFGSERGRRNYRTIIEVANTKLELLFWLRDRFGGSVPPTCRKGPSLRARPVWRWTLAGLAPITRMLEGILPYLVLKRAQAVLALEFAATKEKGGRPISAENHAKRTDICTKIRALNHRGIEVVA